MCYNKILFLFGFQHVNLWMMLENINYE